MNNQSIAAFDARWETDIYGAQRQLNLYPFDCVTSFVFSHFGRAEHRDSISILDVGSGAGNHLWFLAREGFKAFGIEGSQSAVEFAERRLIADGLQADLRCGDFRDLPWPDQFFDAVVDRGSITHNRRSEVERCLGEIKRVLRPGGKFFSQVFSDRHSGRLHGVPQGDGSYDNFARGYFADISLTFFVNQEDIEDLYGSRFVIEKLDHVHIQTIDAEDEIVAYWNIASRAIPITQSA